MFNFSTAEIVNLLLTIPAILISLTFHEYFHAYTAYKQGDNTAKAFGRLTLNPIKHIDILGFICLMIAHFGWARPVPINPRNFKKYKKGMFLVSLAGPLSNLCLAFLGTILMCGIQVLSIKTPNLISSSMLLIIFNFFSIFISINVSLFVFNLLPIPPLDGSKIFGLFMPAKIAVWFMKYERYIEIVLMILLITGRLSPIIQTVGGYILSLLYGLAMLIFTPFM